MMRNILYCLLAILLPAFASSQDLVGLWKGTLLNDTTGHILEYEVVINKEKGKYSGFSHTWFLINDQRYYGIKKINVRIAKDGKVVIQDGALIENNYPVTSPKHVSQLNVLDLAKLGDETVLNGVFVTNQ